MQAVSHHFSNEVVVQNIVLHHNQRKIKIAFAAAGISHNHQYKRQAQRNKQPRNQQLPVRQQ
jgi:hypothetical protein